MLGFFICKEIGEHHFLEEKASSNLTCNLIQCGLYLLTSRTILVTHGGVEKREGLYGAAVRM